MATRMEGLPFCTLWPEKLFLAALVSLIEHIHTTGGVHQLHLARVERVGSVGDFQLDQRVLNTFYRDVLLGGSAAAGYEDGVIGHILESYKTVGFGMNSFLHFT